LPISFCFKNNPESDNISSQDDEIIVQVPSKISQEKDDGLVISLSIKLLL